MAAAFLAAVPSFGAEKKVPVRIALESPKPNTMTDGNFCDVDVSVPAGSPFKGVEISPEGEQAGVPLRFPVDKGHARGKVPLAPGKNVYSVAALDGAGRRTKGPSFKVFRTSKGSDQYEFTPTRQSGKGLSYLQPAGGSAPSYGGSSNSGTSAFSQPLPRLHCGYPANTRMSISVPGNQGVNGNTSYITIQTDSRGCFYQ